jgi:hypothetical protein
MHHKSEISLARRYIKVGRYAEAVPLLKAAVVYAEYIVIV